MKKTFPMPAPFFEKGFSRPRRFSMKKTFPAVCRIYFAGSALDALISTPVPRMFSTMMSPYAIGAFSDIP